VKIQLLLRELFVSVKSEGSWQIHNAMTLKDLAT